MAKSIHDFAIFLARQHPWEMPSDARQVLEELGGPMLGSIWTQQAPGRIGDLVDEVGTWVTKPDATAPAVLAWCGLALHAPPGEAGAILQRARLASLGLSGNWLASLPALLAGFHALAGGQSTASLGSRIDGPLITPTSLARAAMQGEALPIMRFSQLPWLASQHAIRMIDAVECGRVDEAASLAAQRGTVDDPATRALVKAYTALAWLQQAVMSRGIHAVSDKTADGKTAVWQLVGEPRLEALVQDVFAAVSTSSSAATAMRQVQSSPGDLAVSHLLATAGIRRDLANGRIEAASLALQQRASAGISSWADRIYRMRMLGAAETHAGAELPELIGELRSACTVFDGNGRVEFELQAARELGLWKLLRSTASARARGQRLPGDGPMTARAGRLVGRSPAMLQITRRIERLADSDLPVLVTGASGTGKEIVARMLHEASPRAGQAFVSVNCAALSDNLLESELFGHVRGAYSGSSGPRAGLILAAGKGTLFLDEIGDTSGHFQAALLRLLESGEFRQVGSDTMRQAVCRIIAATNRDLAALAAQGTFRLDLLHRLDRLRIHLPPLSDRLEDIPDLAQAFLAEATGDASATMDSALIEVLSGYTWPGNVRELRNRIAEMVAMHPGVRAYGVAQYADGSDLGRALPGPSALPVDVVGRMQDPEPGRTVSPTGDGDGQAPRSSERNLPDTRLRMLSELMRGRRRMTRVEAAQLLDVCPMTATAYLKRLCGDGVVRKVMPTHAPRTHYFEWIG